MNKSEYCGTQRYKDLLAVTESVNNLPIEVVDLITKPGRQVVVFDPFQHDTLMGLCETNYLMARDLIVSGAKILTNQMGLLELVNLGDEEIYIINNQSKAVLISNETLDISKEIRPTHNLFRMWRSGGLGEQFR